MKKFLFILLLVPCFVKAQITMVTLDASKSKDSDGVIVHYKWSVVGTPPIPVTIANDTLVRTTVVPSGGKQWAIGTYTFQVTVTDNGNPPASSSAQTHVTWSATNPTVNAGADQTIQLPINSTQLRATGTASLGIAKSWAWTQISGANTAIFNRKDTSVVTVSGLVAGVYNFQVALTDNFNQIATDQVTIIVKAANILPKADAGADQSLQLPNNSVSIGGIDAPADVAVRWTRKQGYYSTISSPTGHFTKVKFYAPGKYVFTKTVTDQQGRSAADDVTVIVTRKKAF